MITLNYSLGYLKSWINQPRPPFLVQKPPFVVCSNHASLRLSIKSSPFQAFLSILTEVLLSARGRKVINKCLIFGWECLVSGSVHVIPEWLSLDEDGQLVID